MTEEERALRIRTRIEQDPDYIYSSRYQNSLKIFIEKNPKGVEEDKIAKLLLLSEEEVGLTLLSALRKLKVYLGE